MIPEPTEPPAPSCAGLVLAAGAGTRFGSPKALVAFDGELLVRRAVRLLHDGGCDQVTVVLGAQADRVRAMAHLDGAQRRLEVVVAQGWATGMGASLRTGLAALAQGPAQACIVALVDTPLVGAEAVRRLRAAWADGALAAIATYDGLARNPVLLDRGVWADVSALAQGDTAARAWLRAHPEHVTSVACDDTGSPADVDTPEDLLALTALTDASTDHRRVRT